MPDDASLFVTLKAIHMITLSITLAGFMLRGYWMLRGSPLLASRAVRILPHVNDTILFVSAVWAAVLINQYPFVDAWLTAKVLGAVAYIVLGAVALTYGAQAEAGTKGASASAGDTKGEGMWKRGMAVFTLAKGGLMYEASIGGQKYNFKPL